MSIDTDSELDAPPLRGCLSLPVEIWELILDELTETFQYPSADVVPPLQALRTTCRALANFFPILRRLFARLHLHATQQHSDALVQANLASASFLSHVQTVIFHSTDVSWSLQADRFKHMFTYWSRSALRDPPDPAVVRLHRMTTSHQYKWHYPKRTLDEAYSIYTARVEASRNWATEHGPVSAWVELLRRLPNLTNIHFFATVHRPDRNDFELDYNAYHSEHDIDVPLPSPRLGCLAGRSQHTFADTNRYMLEAALRAIREARVAPRNILLEADMRPLMRHEWKVAMEGIDMSRLENLHWIVYSDTRPSADVDAFSSYSCSMFSDALGQWLRPGHSTLKHLTLTGVGLATIFWQNYSFNLENLELLTMIDYTGFDIRPFGIWHRRHLPKLQTMQLTRSSPDNWQKLFDACRERGFVIEMDRAPLVPVKKALSFTCDPRDAEGTMAAALRDENGVLRQEGATDLVNYVTGAGEWTDRLKAFFDIPPRRRW